MSKRVEKLINQQLPINDYFISAQKLTQEKYEIAAFWGIDSPRTKDATCLGWDHLLKCLREKDGKESSGFWCFFVEGSKQDLRWFYFLYKFASMSASHEKSPTELTLRQHPSSRSSSTFSFCVWVPVCATLACWQVSNETRSVLGQTKMVPVRWTKYPAVPTGLAVGTNPPGLPSGDHRWGVWEWVKSSVPRIRSVGYSSIQIRY